MSLSLIYRLADVAPLAYRPPHAIMQRIQERLSKAERAAADQLIDDLAARCVAGVAAQRARPAAQRLTEEFEDDAPADATREADQPGRGVDPDSARAQIEAAIRTGGSLRMRSYTASRARTSERRVTPHRIEVRRRVAYLIGYCHRAGAERTFRIDRILGIEPLGH